VEVFKLRDETWNARIEAGAEGLLKAEWAPDGRHILCFSQWGVSRIPSWCPSVIDAWQLRVTIWSLVSGNATYIQFPIHPDRGTVSIAAHFLRHLIMHKAMLSAPIPVILSWLNDISPKTRLVCMIQLICID
jgi:hypothetical protein